MYWDFVGPTVIADTSSLTTRRPWYSMVYNDAVQGLALSPYGMTDASHYQVQHLAGQKQYELTNHLGNVQATISDLPVKVGEAHTEYHAPALPAVYDYYPFGMLMPDRYTSDTSSECVTVSQTKWVTTWVTHCYLAADWVWPAYSYYGSVSVSTSSGLQIAAGESSGIFFEIDVLPYEQQDVYLQTDAFYSGSGTLELQEYHGGQWHMLGSTTFDKIGEVRISIRPREDRILAVLRGPFYVQVKQFCVQRPQLSQETVLVDICDTDGDKYRFGFNGQEKVNEWAGIGNYNDFLFRGQDSRIGRFLSVDPLAPQYPWNSPYAFAENDVIRAVDLEGLEKYIVSEGKMNDNVYRWVTRNPNKAEWDLARFGYTDENGQLSIFSQVPFGERDEKYAAQMDTEQNTHGIGHKIPKSAMIKTPTAEEIAGPPETIANRPSVPRARPVPPRLRRQSLNNPSAGTMWSSSLSEEQVGLVNRLIEQYRGTDAKRINVIFSIPTNIELGKVVNSGYENFNPRTKRRTDGWNRNTQSRMFTNTKTAVDNIRGQANEFERRLEKGTNIKVDMKVQTGSGDIQVSVQ
jgi:RHS repeat-associated protein